MEQKRAPRNKPMYIQLAHLQHGSQEYIWGKGSPSISGAGKTGHPDIKE